MLVGAVLVIVIGSIAIVAIASLRTKPASVASGSTLVLHLEGDLPERSPVELPFGGFGQRTSLTMLEINAALHKAATDSRIQALVLEPYNLNVGWGKMEELHTDLEQFAHSGKPLYAYLKTPGTREYYVATAAAKIYLSPQDMLNLKGLRFELMYFRHTLDKLGVTVDIEHAGKYKDFGDMYTRSDMSPETKEVLNSVMDRLYGDLVKTIGLGRKKSIAEVQDAINNGPLLSKQVQSRGLVDQLCYEDEMFGKLKRDIRADIHKVDERDYVRSFQAETSFTGRPKIAFVVAQGDIMRGDPESSGTGGEAIESEGFNKLLARVGSDSSIKGVIVRIDSPGGESFASDELWRAMNQLAKKKPMVISMSDTAASGGYYMAMNGTPVIAYPGTLTGSIGVVFGKPNLHGLYDKLGIDKDTIARGRFASIDSDYKPLDDAEKAKLREGIDDNYHSFVQKVADSRKRPFNQIEPIAQGRVWLGDQAKDNGLVDELGGIDRAVQVIKQRSSIGPNDPVTLVSFPAKRTLLEMILAQSGSDTTVQDRVLSLLHLRSAALPPLLHSPEVRAWLLGGTHGGYLSISPWALSIQ